MFLGTPPVPVVYPEARALGHAASRIAAKAARRISSPLFEMYGHEDLPGAIEGWQAVAPIRPDTPYSRSLCLLDGMGEAFAALPRCLNLRGVLPAALVEMSRRSDEAAYLGRFLARVTETGLLPEERYGDRTASEWLAWISAGIERLARDGV